MTDFTVATINVGNGSSVKALRLAKSVDATALQEVSDRDGLIERLRADPQLRVVRRERRPGQAAVALVWKRNVLELRHRIVRLVAHGQPVGPGTGPDEMKAKWLEGGSFRLRACGSAVTIATTHRVAGQTRDGDSKRDRVAERHAAAVVRELEHAPRPIVPGDWNSLPLDDSLAPFRRERWTCDQLQLERLNTHGGWCPDHVWFRPWSRGKSADLRVVDHWLADSIGSDHDPLVVRFRV